MKPGAKNRKRVFTYVLLIVVIGIWARVIYSVYRQVEEGEQLLSESASLSGKAVHMNPTVLNKQPAYEGDFSDPFEPASNLFYVPVPKRRKASIPEKEIAPEIPALALIGVTGITATVSSVDETVHFVKPGDVIGEVKILDVKQDQILAKFGSKTFTLKLKP